MKINIQNIDTYLMSYIDNELSLADTKELEIFLEAHPAYAKELALLKQTILEADEVVYEDKQLLYRYSEMEATLPSAFKNQLYRQETKVVEGFFTMTKIISISSVAALFLLFIGYRFYISNNDLSNTFFSQLNKMPFKNSNVGSLANTAQPSINGKLDKDNGEALITADNNIIASKNLALEKVPNFKIVNKKQIVSDKQKQSDIEVSNLIAFNSNEQNAAGGSISETNITPNSNTPELINKTIAELEPTNNNETTNESSKQAIANTKTQLEEKENYENIDTDDHDRSVYIANLEIDGDKIRGFSRRINAIFKRNKNDKQK